MNLTPIGVGSPRRPAARVPISIRFVPVCHLHTNLIAFGWMGGDWMHTALRRHVLCILSFSHDITVTLTVLPEPC